MVNIKIDVKNMEISVDGHANTAPPGYDLVCCSISTLIETLSVYLEHQMDEGKIRDLKEERVIGHVYINASPYGWSLEETQTAFSVIRYGLLALAETYSGCIKVKEE